MSKNEQEPIELDPSPGSTPSDEALKSFDLYWKDFVCDEDGRLNRNAVIKELYDYGQILANTTKVFYEITDGRISKPNTSASSVVGAAEEVTQEIWDREIEALEVEFDNRVDTLKAIWEFERFELREEILRLKAQLPPQPSDALVMDAEFTEVLEFTPIVVPLWWANLGAIPGPEVEIELSESDIIEVLYPEEV